ncbi:hypothetical protein LAUMK41_05375 [Mycobacterium attenuatum]|nr:hypothetical protein LAUMK41_05375 [Mycobacterium attenuatum]
MGQRSRRFEPFDKHLERHVLMFVGGQAALAHLGKQLGEGRIPIQVDPQHQRVDEKAHQLVKRGITATGDRESHCHVGAGTQARQQRGQRGLDHHETGRVVLAGQLAHPLLQLCRPVHGHRCSAVVGDRRVGPIGGQLQALRHPGQGLLPVGQLGGQRAVRIGQLTEIVALPQRVIDVLQR